MRHNGHASSELSAARSPRNLVLPCAHAGPHPPGPARAARRGPRLNRHKKWPCRARLRPPAVSKLGRLVDRLPRPRSGHGRHQGRYWCNCDRALLVQLQPAPTWTFVRPGDRAISAHSRRPQAPRQRLHVRHRTYRREMLIAASSFATKHDIAYTLTTARHSGHHDQGSHLVTRNGLAPPSLSSIPGARPRKGRTLLAAPSLADSDPLIALSKARNCNWWSIELSGDIGIHYRDPPN